jgi:pimeloyl-ACP methyl ester carboxylesterase
MCIRTRTGPKLRLRAVATYVLIHGGGGGAWDWHLVVPELRALGHDVVAMDLPSDDESAGLSEYADTVVDAIGDRTDLVVVGHSFGAFTAALVCARVPVDLLVLVSGMIALPGERPGDWWENTGHEQARREQGVCGGDDPIATYMHDVPPELAAEALTKARDSTAIPLLETWPLEAWPDVPTRFLLCRDDRYFPAEWMRGVVQERLGIAPDEIDGSHAVMLSRPKELAERLDAYRR